MGKEPSERYLLDSDVLINYLRRGPNAYRLMKMIEGNGVPQGAALETIRDTFCYTTAL